MHIDIVSLHRLWSPPEDLDAVVVIDVLRSFTTAAVAISRGARTIYLAEGPAAAFALWRRRPHASLVGALGGGHPVPGFDFGNSPSQIAGASLVGQDIILSTAAGVQGLLRFSATRNVFAASFCNAKATARALALTAPKKIALVATGEWVTRDGDEDFACADYIERLLAGFVTNSEEFAKRIRASDFAKQFGTPDHSQLPLEDLDYAAGADQFDFALRLTRLAPSGELALVAERPKTTTE